MRPFEPFAPVADVPMGGAHTAGTAGLVNLEILSKNWSYARGFGVSPVKFIALLQNLHEIRTYDTLTQRSIDGEV